MKKRHWLLAIAITGLAVTTSAQARDSFSLGISIGNPYYYAPPPVYYNPPPVVYYNVPQVVYYGAPQVVYGYPNGGYYRNHYGHHNGHRWNNGQRWNNNYGHGRGHHNRHH